MKSFFLFFNALFEGTFLPQVLYGSMSAIRICTEAYSCTFCDLHAVAALERLQFTV